MDYSLAKQLKDAGFPQKEFGVGEIHYHKQGEVCYSPSLLALIKACITDKEEKCFYKLDYYWLEKKWQACAGTGRDHFEAYGETPEEAVAKLWLELAGYPQENPCGNPITLSNENIHKLWLNLTGDFYDPTLIEQIESSRDIAIKKLFKIKSPTYAQVVAKQWLEINKK